MNANETKFRASGGAPTQCDILAALFKHNPGKWLDMPSLAQAMDGFPVHSRICDLRKKRGMRIEHRGGRQPGSRKQLSWYQYIPPAAE